MASPSKKQESTKDLVLSISLILLAFGALFDAFYLTVKHYSKEIPPCSIHILGDCGQVLTSQYATIFGIPVALLGMFHYFALVILLLLSIYTAKKLFIRLAFLSTSVGFVVSLYLVILQLTVIKAICQYCMISAFFSFIIYFLIRIRFKEEYRELIPKKIAILYALFGKPAFFVFDPEWVHDNAMRFGELFGKISAIRSFTAFLFKYEHKALKQSIEGINFKNPVGLAAGYDYEAAFPHILPSIGFGFETIGTITNHPSEGNPKPRLGRLPKSKSLLVNKGFRNLGTKKIIEKLVKKTFAFPVGISIGTTNDAHIKTLDEAIQDIITTFKTFEKSSVKHTYYELNISCPNLQTKVNFYDPKGLSQLLKAVGGLKIKRPVFIKMPIEKTDEEVTKMLDVIVKHTYVTGVIFGNLQKNRKDKAFVKEEIENMGKGNFSGKPTFKRSNELITLCYKKYGKKLVIIGCGGVFSAEDAYTKIRLGASLVQLITGMIFVGPQLISQINRGLVELIERDGYKHISEAIGVDVNK